MIVNRKASSLYPHSYHSKNPCSYLSRDKPSATNLRDSSSLGSCPFCHNPTLGHYRLPSVTTTSTKTSFGTNLRFPSIAGPLAFILFHIASGLNAHTEQQSRYFGTGHTGHYWTSGTGKCAPVQATDVFDFLTRRAYVQIVQGCKSP